MDTQNKHLEARHTELFAALAEIHVGISVGTIRSLEQVQQITSRFIPVASRGAAPTNPATLIATGKESAETSRMEYKGRQIITNFDHPPIPSRSNDWSAFFDDYDGAEDSNCPVGRGATEKEAVGDLIEKAEAAHA